MELFDGKNHKSKISWHYLFKDVKDFLNQL
jgi:hypothetical protein